MKCELASILLLLITSNIQCHVTNRTMINEESTYSSENNKNDLQDIKDRILTKIRDKIGIRQTVDDESKVFLDVYFILKSYNWTDEEKPCIHKIYLLLEGLQNFTLWSVWGWEAQASEPQGLFFGNRFQLGNFDQCMESPWSQTNPELNMKYCLANIELERADKTIRKRDDERVSPYASTLDFMENRPLHTRTFNKIVWGLCVPKSCVPSASKKLLTAFLSISYLGTSQIKSSISVTEQCQVQNEQPEFDGLFYAFIALSGLLVATALICTYFNNRKKNTDGENCDNIFIKSFCLKENSHDLLKMNKDGLEVFYGIKFLTICLIVMDHQIAMTNSGPISNGITTDKIAQSLLGSLLLHDDVFVDTFFLLAGFLMMVKLQPLRKLPNPLLTIFKRYFRLVVGFAMVIFYNAAIYPYTGSGPLWHLTILNEADLCRKNWWLNILMVQNYVDVENMCMVTSWYIPCDFHFFVLSLLIYWIYNKQPLLGKMLAGAVAIVSLILPGIITYIYRLSAIQEFTIDFASDPRNNTDFKTVYVKSHHRYASYAIGIFSGYLFVKNKDDYKLNKISMKWSIIGSILSCVVMIAIMFTGSSFLWKDYNPIEAAIYASLNRPAWACGVAVLVFCCVFGEVPLLKSFLSWYPWVPLSRLSYGLYLIHAIFILRNVFVARNPQHNDVFLHIIGSSGLIVWGCIGALILWLFVEAPANKLLYYCLKSKFQKRIDHNVGKPQELYKSDETLATSSTGQLYENYSSKTHFSYKL